MYKKVFKRIFDVLLSVFGLVVLGISFVFLAPIIFLTDKGTVFYKSKRLGKHGRVFTMYKYRSMYMGAPDIRNEDGSTFNASDDARVTCIGKFMRKNSIDELPQFINVLKGEMSVIGPRPDLPDDMKIYTEEQKKKLKVRPGITGYSQAYYRNSLLQDEKFANDVFYVDNMSFMLDARIFFKTILTVLRHKNVYSNLSSPLDVDIVSEE